jgi:hypothetical protein
MKLWEFEILIADVASRLTREQLEAEFVSFYAPASNLSQDELDELVGAFMSEDFMKGAERGRTEGDPVVQTGTGTE